MRAFSLNRGEITLLKTRPAGWRPGQDVAGVVVKPAATGGPPAGARVVALADQAGWAERIAIGINRVAELPSEVTFEEAATLPIAGLTALRTLRRGGWLIGKRVLPAAVVYSEDQRAKAKELGAEDVVLATAETAARSSSSGTRRAKRRSSSRSGWSRTGMQTTPEHAGRTASEDLTTLARMVAQRKVVPQIALLLSWRDFRRGFEALAERNVHGKVVYRVD